MYYCLTCNKIHENDSSATKVFGSGYILVEEKKVPLGLCKDISDFRKSRRVPFKGSLEILNTLNHPSAITI